MGVSRKHLITNQYLQILNIDETDEATYACTVRNTVEIKTASASLTVLRKEKLLFLFDI